MTEPKFSSSNFEEIPDPLGPRSVPVVVAPLGEAEAPRTRDDARRDLRLAALLGAGWLVGQFAITGIRSDMAHVPLSYQIACGAAPVVGGLSCLVAALSPGRLGLGIRVTLLAALAVTLPLLFTLSNYVLSPPYPEAPLGSFKHGVFCFNIALAWTLLPLIAAGIALRTSFVSRAMWRSTLVGLGAGLIVATTSMLRCPLSGAWHMALSHGGAVVASALLGALVLSRVTRV